MALTPGTRLGPYEILAPLGAGGMGEVYRARDSKLNRDVAIKVLLPAVANDPDRLARFSREAQVLASLNHPNIGAIYGLEDGGDVRALVMELVEGPTLADRIAQGAVPLADALPIAKQIAEALEAAHEQGIIHRDLKPANIKVRDDGTVKVLDFGLAKATDPASPSSANAMNSPTLTAATVHGVILGTAAYMSPEQAAGKPVDKRSDLWAFGVVLLEMLTGRQMFTGETVSHVLAAVLATGPDWTKLPPDTPAPIRTLLRRCLEKDRKQRLDSAAAVRLDIDDALVGTATPGGFGGIVARSPWRRALPFAATAIVAVVFTGIAVWSVRPSTPAPTVTRFSFPLAEGQQFTNGGRPLVALSPDGTQMVYVANNRLYLRSMSETEARLIPGTEEPSVTSPAFSPDGRSIAFVSGREGAVKRIAVGGGVAITLCPISTTSLGLSWGADGIVFGQRGVGIMRVSSNGGQPELLVSVKNDEVAFGPHVLPGGQAVLFTLVSGAGTGVGTGNSDPGDMWDKAHIVVQSLTSAERKTLITGGSDAQYVPTDHLVYAVGGVLFAVTFDLRRLQVVGGPVPIVQGVRRGAATGAANFGVSANGSLIYVPGPVSTRQRDLALIDRLGSPQPLKLQGGLYEYPRVSPDGQRVAVETDDGKDANIWIYDLTATSSLRRLTLAGRNEFPVWSADSARVAFQSNREGDLAIFWQRADGSGTAERLTKPDPDTTHVPSSWSPDGKRLLFTERTGSNTRAWRIPKFVSISWISRSC